MKLSIVIPTRGDQNMKNMTKCLQRQTFRDFEVIFIVDKKLDTGCMTPMTGKQVHDIGNIRYITEANSDFVSQKNASYNRNFGIKYAKGEYINIFDDDVVFDDDYLEKSLKYLEYFSNITGNDVVIAPTMMYRKTGVIQSQGFSYFDFLLCKPIACVLGDKKYAKIKMFSGNSLLGKASIFKNTLFDEIFDFVNEDLDFSYRISKKYPMFVVNDLKIYHIERDKTILENLRIGSEFQAYRRVKHRILFVRKNGNWYQKFLAYLFGLAGNTIRLFLRIMKYGQGTKKTKLIKAIRKGVVDGVRG